MSEKTRNLCKKIIKKVFSVFKIDFIVRKLFLNSKSEKCSLDVVDAMTHLQAFSASPTGSCIRCNQIEGPLCDLQIIIPAYNVEKYIEECIESVLCQKTTYTYKIVVVNDGSTDRTGEIIEKYRYNENIIVINQKNRGFSGARNRGLENIFGRYIAFLDSDDKLAPGAIDALLTAAYEEKADIVEGGFYKLYNQSLVIKYKHKCKRAVLPNDLKGFPCGKVFSASLFEKICFPEGFWFEDSIMALIVYPCSKKNIIIPDMVYIYRYNDKSISNTFSKNKKAIDTYWVTEKAVNERAVMNLSWHANDYVRVCEQFVVNYKRTSGMDDDVQKAIFVCTGDLIERIGLDEDACPKKFKSLIRSFKIKDFGQYAFFCKTYFFE